MFTIVYWISCNFIIVLYIRLEFFRCNVFFTRQNEHAQKTGCVSEVMYTQLCANRYQVCCNLSRAERNFHFFFLVGVEGGGVGGVKNVLPNCLKTNRNVWKCMKLFRNGFAVAHSKLYNSKSSISSSTRLKPDVEMANST